jgi:hypothetical protein
MGVLERRVPIAAWALAFAVGLECCASAAQAASAPADAYVLGDSIGEGVAIASGLKKLARISIHIRGSKAIDQVNATPIGAIAFIVLGTNDAEGSLKDIDKSIDDVVRAGKRRKLKMIWLGPSCVRRSFDSQARDLDKILSDRLPGMGVKYVSMRDERLCSGVFHEPDGVHLTMKGYRYMWAKTEQAVSWPALAGADSAEPAAAPSEQRLGNAPAGAVVVAAAQSAPVVSSPDGGDRIGPMVVEMHRPPHGLSSPIVWTGLSN